MKKFAIRSISKETMSLPSSDQARYFSKNWMAAGAALVAPDSRTLLVFRSKKSAEQFVVEANASGFGNIRVQEV